jgi:N-acetylmuramoyl-L-alanine amidase
MREELNQRPKPERTRHDYQKVISAYREIYYGAPTSTKADPSAAAVARLQVEMGRRFENAGILRSAVAQFQFLRREYPGSSARFEALFTIGEVYRDDLNDSAHARAAFEEFLRRYPRHHLAEEARKAVAEVGQQAAQQKPKDGRDSQAQDEDGPVDTAGKKDSDSAAVMSETGAATATVPEGTNKDASRTGEDARHSILPSGEDAENSTVGRKLPRVTGVRYWSTPDYTRVAIDLDHTAPGHDLPFESQRIDHPDRIFFDLPDTKLASTLVGKTFDVDDGFLKKIRVAQFQPGRTRIVLEVDDLSDYDAFLLPNPSRLIIDVHGVGTNAYAGPPKATTDADAATPMILPSEVATDSPPTNGKRSPTAAASSTSVAKKAVTRNVVAKKIVDVDDDDDVAVNAPDLKRVAKPVAAPGSGARISDRSFPDRPKIRAARNTHEALPNASGDRSLIRALGLKIGKIVIDPGHGGHDTGTIGPNGFEEKTLVLDVSKRLGKLLETRLGAEVDYTRRDDTFIPLETRTAIANQNQADLFVSIHANASRDPDARGVETYYLNFTSSPDALEVAARENAVSEESIYQLQDLVKKIALKEKIAESREFASDVQKSLHSGLAAKSPGIRDRGVRKAPFIVLIGANMPSILAEISFVSNPDDERRLRTPEYRQKIAESLYRGIAKYVSGLSGVKVASKIDKSAGQ